MVPTTEQPPRRFFNVLRKDGHRIKIEAETVCDVDGNGKCLKFKRHGEVVGISQGGARAWWVEETGSQGKAYCVEAAAGEFIRIAADSFENKGKNGFRMEFFREGEAVGVIYAVPAHADWWVGNDLPTRSAAGG